MTGVQAETDDAILASVLGELKDVEIAPPPPEERAPPESAWSMPGFTGKSRVLTSFGELPIEALRKRDALRTITGDFLPVVFTDVVHLESAFLNKVPEARPVMVRSNAVAKGMPKRDMSISRYQLVNASQMPEDAKTVSQLLSRMALPASKQDVASYYLFHCGRRAIVQVDGMWCVTGPHETGAF